MSQVLLLPLTQYQGILDLQGNFSAEGTIGSNPDNLNTINLLGGPGTVVTFNNFNVFASNINVSNGGILDINGNANIDGTLNLSNGSVLNMGNNDSLFITNQTGAGVLNLASGTNLTIDMERNFTSVGPITTSGTATTSPTSTLTILNTPYTYGEEVFIPTRAGGVTRRSSIPPGSCRAPKTAPARHTCRPVAAGGSASGRASH